MSSDHISINRDYWNAMAGDWVAAGERLWALDQPEWGNWGLPEAELQLLPRDMAGMTAVELGCGTGYVSGWMARRGADVTGIDQSANQLDTARRLAMAHNIRVRFVEGNAEATGFPAEQFDFAISEYGAAIWCDPEVWLREAWRILHPGGVLVFLGNHPLTIACSPASGAEVDYTLHRPYRDMTGADWTGVEIDPGGVEFNRTVSDWMSLFSVIGYEIIDYRELYAPENATGTLYSMPAEWAKQYPCEQVWWLAKP